MVTRPSQPVYIERNNFGYVRTMPDGTERTYEDMADAMSNVGLRSESQRTHSANGSQQGKVRFKFVRDGERAGILTHLRELQQTCYAYHFSVDVDVAHFSPQTATPALASTHESSRRCG